MGGLSLDLRERVLAAYDRSGHKSHTCAEFGIARTTLDKWLKLRERIGSLRINCAGYWSEITKSTNCAIAGGER